MEKWKTTKLKRLAKAMLTLKKGEDMLGFLRDLLTLDELEEISGRWQAVELLDKGKTYREIAEKTGLSTTTVTRIAHWLEHGEGGYGKALKNIKKHPIK
jgi:TrpR-related protein YerC/YecD